MAEVRGDECDEDAEGFKERQHFASVLRAFDYYERWASARLSRVEADYRRLSPAHQQLLGIDAKVKALRAAVRQNAEVLALIEEELKILEIGYAKLTGQTRKRQEAIDLFQSGAVRVFLISLKAGGSGLNLTAADVVIHMDPWWNPAVENQATDRAHRIGQDKPVFVYKLVASDTVEERIQLMQQQKQALADNLFNEAGSIGQPVDKETLLSLLQ